MMHGLMGVGVIAVGIALGPTNYLGVGMLSAILIACAIAAPFGMYVFRVFKGE
jgi:hypothetical protein